MELFRLQVSMIALLEFLIVMTPLSVLSLLIYRFLSGVYTRNRLLRKIYRIYPILLVPGYFIIFLYFSYRVLEYSPIYYFFLFFFCLGFVFFLSRNFIKDLFTGMILTSENRWEAGLQLKLDEVEGELKKVGFFALELLQKDGSRVRIPYRLLLEKQFVVRSGRKEELRGHTFELICEKGTRYSSIERKIMEIIYNYPWTSLAREPIIKNISRPGGELELEITVYTLGNTNYNELEKKIISGITRDPKKEGNR